MKFRRNSFELLDSEEKRFMRLCCRSVNRETPAAFAGRLIKKKRRAEFLVERRNKLIQILESEMPDPVTVYACRIYLRAYFGSERRMIFELINSHLQWQIKSLFFRTEYQFEKIYYRLIKGYSESQWQAKINEDFQNVCGEDG